MSAVANTISSFMPASLVGAFTRGIKSFVAPAEPSEYQRTGSELWVEISPYGFISRNYLNYVAGNTEGCRNLKVGQGNLALKFADGGMLIVAPTGHLVELDRMRRVVLVRVTKAEAEGAKLTLGSVELKNSFRATTDKDGKSIVVMPGHIIIKEGSDTISIVLPNGVEVSARKKT